MTTAPELDRRYTADDLLSMEGGGAYELVDGRLVELDMGFESQVIAQNVSGELYLYLREHPLGLLAGAEAGLTIFGSPRRLRRADLSFIRSDRLPGALPRGHLSVAPDLVIEVVSPGDTAEDVEEKVLEYLAAGVREAWMVYPRTRSVEVVDANGMSRRLREGDELTSPSILPGFAVPVSRLFAAPGG